MDPNTESYNRSGVFLQTFVGNELEKQGWEKIFEHPVVIAPFNSDPNKAFVDEGFRGPPSVVPTEKYVQAMRDCQNKFLLTERSIDVIGSKAIKNTRIKLCIECKKLNPKYVEWCFFQQNEIPKEMHFITKSIRTTGQVRLFEVPKTEKYHNEIYVEINYRYNQYDLFPNTIADFGIALTNEKLKDEYFKTEKTVVDEACRQIIEGTYGLILESLIHQILTGTAEEYSGATDVYLPIVVTNASLKLCKYDPKKIDPKTGHLTEEPKYEKINSIVYECNSPKNVQFPSPLFANLLPVHRRATSKWYVLIMTPKGLHDLLQKFNEKVEL